MWAQCRLGSESRKNSLIYFLQYVYGGVLFSKQASKQAVLKALLQACMYLAKVQMPMHMYMHWCAAQGYLTRVCMLACMQQHAHARTHRCTAHAHACAKKFHTSKHVRIYAHKHAPPPHTYPPQPTHPHKHRDTNRDTHVLTHTHSCT